MSRKFTLAFIVFAVIVSAYCVLKYPSVEFAPQSVVESIDAHTVAIATYFTVPAEQAEKLACNGDAMLMPSDTERFWRERIPQPMQERPGTRTIAYIGAGTILKDNHIITVRHLFDKDYEYQEMAIWVFKAGLDHAVRADVVAISDSDAMSDDYAVIKLREDLGLPGLKIAESGDLKKGDKIIWSGSVGGMAFFTRFGYVTDWKYYFRKADDGTLHLSFYEEFNYWCLYPGGPGDSGGSVKNVRGEIVTIMYCGLNVYKEHYIFGNPVSMLWAFLSKHNLGYLGK